MRAWLFLLTALLVIPRFAFAQETPESAEWTTEQRCITAPSLPPDGWAFDGVIFTFRQGEGIHARRADVPTRYYVAFDGNTEFAGAGSLSPDGRWFAVPAGSTRRNINLMRDYNFRVNEVRVYTTNPPREMMRIPIFAYTYYSMSSLAGISPVLWLDSSHAVARGSPTPPSYLNRVSNSYVFDLDDRTLTPFSLSENAIFVSASPDSERWIYYEQSKGVFLANPINLNDVVRIPITETQNPPALYLPQWTEDSTKFAAMFNDRSGVGVFNRDGDLLDEFAASGYRTHLSHYSFARDGARLAYILSSGYDQVQTESGLMPVSRAGSIQIADFVTRTITDTCIETPYSIAFSPDGQNLAFGLEPAGYTYILDLEAWEAYRIDLAANDVIGWYPIS